MGKKKGTNRAWYKTYKDRDQRKKNKVRKLERHLAKFPTDKTAKKALKTVSGGG